ncbi:MAG: hypothetical protein LBV08_01050, partial [Clostridiales bacterium]|nr:hypothetical protein [Clostridiales bacterium]
ILSVDDSFSETFDKLFGETGKLIPGTLKIGNGRLENYNDLASKLGDVHLSELAKVYTSVRQRTKMEGGKAVEGSLRMARVLNKTQVYMFPVSFDGGGSTLELLKRCVKTLRGMGLNRSRGLGEVKCELLIGNEAIKAGKDAFSVADSATQEAALSITDYGTKKVAHYTIKLLEPVISADRNGKPFDCEDYIFGSALVGAFAAKYIKKHKLSHAEAALDKYFRAIFLEGGVIFTAAMPCRGGYIYYPAPAALSEIKPSGTSPGKERGLIDVSAGVKSEEGEMLPIFKPVGGFISLCDEKGGKRGVKQFKPEKITAIHHSRPDDKAIGHSGKNIEGANEKNKAKNNGKLFSYEALAEGQTFVGCIVADVGNERLLEELASLFVDENTINIGRSRTAQYGKVEIGPFQNNMVGGIWDNLEIEHGEEFRMVVITPVILENEAGVNTMDLNILCGLLGDGLEIVRFTCSETAVAGYNGKWLLPRTQDRALAEGSVVVFRNAGARQLLDKQFIGKCKGKGFGQIRIEAVPKPDAFILVPNEVTGGSVSEKQASRDTLPEILEMDRKEKAAAKGRKYGEGIGVRPGNANMQRVVAALNDSKGYNAFVKMLLEIKQPEQKVDALVFATGFNKGINGMYFKSDPGRLEPAHITKLFEECSFSFDEYKKFLAAAAHRVKQIRRDLIKQQKKVGGSNGK